LPRFFRCAGERGNAGRVDFLLMLSCLSCADQTAPPKRTEVQPSAQPPDASC
jgi:hypothetical protein